jgi:hypothetical protein
MRRSSSDKNPLNSFLFSPKRKQATRTPKKNDYSMRPQCPFVRLCFDPRTSRTKKRERERKKGGQEILCMRRKKKKKKFINSSIYPQHTNMVRDDTIADK